jgi:hypothetical protein
MHQSQTLVNAVVDTQPTSGLQVSHQFLRLKLVLGEKKELAPTTQMKYLSAIGAAALPQDSRLSNLRAHYRLTFDSDAVEDDSMQLRVQTQRGKTITLDVKSYNRIEYVSQLVSHSTGIPFDQFRLCVVVDEKSKDKIKPLANYSTLVECDIRPNSTLRMSLGRGSMQIFVKNDHAQGTTITLYVEPSDCVEYVKTLVCYGESIPPTHQRLIHGGRQLKNGCILADYGICATSTVHLVGRL